MTANHPIHPAILFLKVLDATPSATFNIEHFTDVPKGIEKPKPDPLYRPYANRTLQEVEAILPSLEAFNAEGAGIFVTRNQCNGQRNKENVSRVRGIHADMDNVTPVQLERIISILHPSIVVESSAGRFQLYWQLADNETLDKEETDGINRTLAVTYGADSAAVDVSRLLRLPGFKHMKYRANGVTPVVTATFHDRAYTAEEIRRAFPPQPARASKKIAKQQLGEAAAPHNGAPVTPSLVSTVAETLAARHPDLWAGNIEKVVRPTGEIGYPSQSEADLALTGYIARALCRAGANEAALPGSIEAVFDLSQLGQATKWQSRSDYRERTIARALADLDTREAPNAYGLLPLDSHGDVRNAKAFARCTVGEFLYVATSDRWLRWEGERWHVCEKQEHVAQAKEVCKRILASASSTFSQDQERGKRVLQDAIAAHTLPRITAMLKLAISEPGMATTSRELDANPYLIGVQNGVVNLRTGQHLFNQPEFLITRYCNAAFEHDAPCPKWEAFLDQIFQRDIETIESVQRLLGYTLLGLSTEEILVICYGHGSNGKSVFSNVIHKIMGDYAVTAPPSLLTARQQNDTGPRNDLAALAGARYVSINETQAGDRLDEQVVKMLAGREPISARFLHREFFEYMPSFTPWLRTNHKPYVTHDDDGIWRRLVLLPFTRKFVDEEKDANLEEKLLEERNGILLWMIEGGRRFLRDGLRMSPRMRSETASYRKQSDILGEFLTDQTSRDPAAKVNQTTLYDTYRAWCKDCGLRQLSKKSFTQRLAERGYPEGKSGSNRFYVGLKLGSGRDVETQDGMDGITSVLGKSPHENSNQANYPNNPTSCPTCPTAACVKECRDA